MTFGKPTVTGGNRKPLESIPEIPENRHCVCHDFLIPKSSPPRKINIQFESTPIQDYFKEYSSLDEFEELQQRCDTIYLTVFFLTPNFKFTPIFLSPHPRFAFFMASRKKGFLVLNFEKQGVRLNFDDNSKLSFHKIVKKSIV